MIKSENRNRYVLLIYIILYFIISYFTPMNDFLRYEINFKIFAAQDFKKVTKDMFVKQTDSFDIYYNDVLKDDDINFITTSIEKSEDILTNILGEKTSYPLKIVLFSSEEEFKSAFNLEGTTSIYAYNVIYLCRDTITEHKIIHEYTHFRFDYFCEDKKIKSYKIPMWFNEGLAEYSAFKAVSDDESPIDIHVNRLKNFKELDTSSEIAKAHLSGYLPYVQSYLTIENIIDASGVDVVQDILTDSKEMNFYNSLEKNTDMTVEELQNMLIDN
ncbi:gluzincin family metallopeptidase [Clostridium sp. DL1XJH146]